MNSPIGYSANVDLTLLVGEMELPLCQVGPGVAMIRYELDCSLPEGDANLVIKVDEHEEQRQIYLPHGIVAGSREVKFF